MNASKVSLTCIYSWNCEWCSYVYSWWKACFLCQYKSQKGFSMLTHIICKTILCLESVRVYPWCYPRHLPCDIINTKCPPIVCTWFLNTHQVNWHIPKFFRGLDGTNQCCVNSWMLTGLQGMTTRMDGLQEKAKPCIALMVSHLISDQTIF